MIVILFCNQSTKQTKTNILTIYVMNQSVSFGFTSFNI